MRVVVLCSSPYSETGCAMGARLAQLGHVPVGALTLPAWDRSTLLRKLGQWGVGESVRYARSKLLPGGTFAAANVRNPYLEPALVYGGRVIRTLQEVARVYGFPVATCGDQNSPSAVEQVRRWEPDLGIFTGGSILRQEILEAPRLGVLNSHLALLPEIRGMNSPEWSLLCGVPLGITIHLMDSGVDTGSLVLRREFQIPVDCQSLTDLRNRMIAEGIEWTVEAVRALERGAITPVPQASRNADTQYFVMHEQLKIVAEERLSRVRASAGVRRSDG